MSGSPVVEGSGASGEARSGSGSRDELGAHVSSAGGVGNAPDRARAIDSVSLQLFTKQPSRWAEPELSVEAVEAFREARAGVDIAVAGSHDSYLINLASPDPKLWQRSLDCFIGELGRSVALGLDFVVTHPGNATDGNEREGLVRNAEALVRALEEVPGETRVLLELTAGAGTTVGATFENLEMIIRRVPSELQGRVGVCFDTCHAYSAGYDLVDDYDSVWIRFDDVLGLDRLGLFHLNDSKHPFDSRKDRHEHIGEGTLGPEPFRRIMTDERFLEIPKLLETPKGEDMVTFDRKNLALLRSFRAGSGG